MLKSSPPMPLPMPVPSAVISVQISLLESSFVEARLLDVEDLAAQRQDRLELAVAALLGGAAGRIALDDVDLAQRRILLLAVGELAGQAHAVEHALAARHLARLARRLAGARRVDDLSRRSRTLACGRGSGA
jgi:Tfp pilus assembly PilM family ATPase